MPGALRKYGQPLGSEGRFPLTATKGHDTAEKK